MGHYKANLRDLQFNLFEVLKIQEILGNYDLDEATAQEILGEVKSLTEGPLAEGFAEADRHSTTFDAENFAARIPEIHKKIVAGWHAAGFWAMGLPEELSGQPSPRALLWAVNEMMLGANPAAFIYNAGMAFAGVLFEEGNDEQKGWAATCVERNWGATMVLTEPEAGSDVGAGVSKAIKQADGTYHIEGVKRFITNGDTDDMFENLFHLVLARPEGEGPGTKGLSLFFVPKFHFNFETNEMGERNGVYVTNLEKKMGIKVSATAELSFGVHDKPAVGWLIGDGSHNQGIRQMFRVIEHARMMVGTKAIATLSTGYLNALDFCKTRVQGSDITESANKSAPKVTIINHPDVRRSLMMQKVYAEGLRSIYLYTAAHQDDDVANLVSGADHTMAEAVNDLLLPIVKGVGSERSYQYLTDSLQCFGGSGFLMDYPIEQYIRDSKIDSLYEGTTAIQALDFFFRKIAKNRGQALGHVATEISNYLQADGADSLAEARAFLATALGDIQGMLGKQTERLMAAQNDPKQLQLIGLTSVRLLLAVGDLFIGWRLLINAEIAQQALDAGTEEKDKDFYQGKIVAAQFFASNVLPELSSLKTILDQDDFSVMELPESAF